MLKFDSRLNAREQIQKDGSKIKLQKDQDDYQSLVKDVMWRNNESMMSRVCDISSSSSVMSGH